MNVPTVDHSLPQRRVPPFSCDALAHTLLDFDAGWIDNLGFGGVPRNDLALHGFYIYDGVNHIATLRTDDPSMLGVLEGFARERVSRASILNPTGNYSYRRA